MTFLETGKRISGVLFRRLVEDRKRMPRVSSAVSHAMLDHRNLPSSYYREVEVSLCLHERQQLKVKDHLDLPNSMWKASASVVSST